jgi:hypothetical protein
VVIGSIVTAVYPITNHASSVTAVTAIEEAEPVRERLIGDIGALFDVDGFAAGS